MTTTSDWPVVCGPGYEYYLLEERVRNCAIRVDALTARIGSARGTDWQSPAGETFRSCLDAEVPRMRRVQEEITAAADAVRRLAAEMAARDMAEKVRWPG